MIKSKEEQRTIKVIQDIICNKCGKSTEESKETGMGFLAAEIYYSTSYESTHLPDGLTYTFHLCEECLSKLIDELKIEPEIKSYI